MELVFILLVVTMLVVLPIILFLLALRWMSHARTRVARGEKKDGATETSVVETTPSNASKDA